MASSPSLDLERRLYDQMRREAKEQGDHREADLYSNLLKALSSASPTTKPPPRSLSTRVSSSSSASSSSSSSNSSNSKIRVKQAGEKDSSFGFTLTAPSSPKEDKYAEEPIDDDKFPTSPQTTKILPPLP